MINFLLEYFYYKNKTKGISMQNSIKLTMIDFKRPWWYIIFQQPFLLVSVFIVGTVRYLFQTFEPFLVAMLLEHLNWYLFAGGCALWALSEINLIFMSILNPKFQLGVIHSIFYSAHQQLLLIDPLYHAKRSSGTILAKIDRAARGYEDLLDQITFEFAPLGIGVLSMVLVFSRHSWWLTVAVFSCLLIMVLYAYYFARYVCQKKENDFIHSDDDFKTTAFENLVHINVVRASFATDFIRDKLTAKIVVNSLKEQTVWRTYSFVSRVLNAIYTISIVLLVAFFMESIRYGQVSLAHAIGIILAYITCTQRLIKIVQPMRRYLRGYTAAQDLFKAMREFGAQTIPVFEKQSIEVDKDKRSTVEVCDLRFGYSSAHMFNAHSLCLHADSSQSNRLYGLIGPSGVGKTTLLSILGGQLKPLGGTVKIDDIDIYTVGDATRRQLIALQGQVATNVKGSVRDNLLFGLPESHGYSDNYLLSILEKVGLKSVIDEHQGLETMLGLGEGALNLSGGQKQRLNFAALYLRAKFYSPVLILIDEPTSSLDDISEMAVTSMIHELASSAITLVIAHRLKTIERAVGIIDLSLLVESQKIHVYGSDELEVHSSYYRRLLQGAVHLS
jgi:ABC-type multidrug transport system fused ATPase/permease subunit